MLFDVLETAALTTNVLVLPFVSVTAIVELAATAARLPAGVFRHDANVIWLVPVALTLRQFTF